MQTTRGRFVRDARGSGFTLLELLVVIAIIGVLISLLLPSLSQVKIRTRDTQCLGNFKEIGVVEKYYESDNGKFPPRASLPEFDPSTLQWKRKSTEFGLGGANPSPVFPYTPFASQATNRPLYQYQGDPRIFRCPMDQGTESRMHWPYLSIHLKPSIWETLGCSYRYNSSLYAPRDATRSPPMPTVTLRPSAGNLPGKPDTWVADPARHIFMSEPPAQPLGRIITGPAPFVPIVTIPYWTQWHRNRGRIDFLDPTIAPTMFVSPVLFVDGHAAIHDFSKSVMTDPYYPYEETRDWIWYQPR